MWHKDILSTIGSTPIIQLNRLAEGLPCRVLVKLECFNPGGSVKDRIGVAMILAAEKSGQLRPNGTLIEATSGNTGVGIAQAARARGYRCIFTLTEKVSQEKRDLLRAFGAELVICPMDVTHDDPRSYYSVAKKIATEVQGGIYLNQYFNEANVEAHYQTTGPEIWQQTQGRVTHFFATASTGGTISGSARYLREKDANIKVIGIDPCGSAYYKYFHEGVVDPDEVYSHQIEGAGKEYLAGNMHMNLLDDYTRVSDRDAMHMARQLVKEEAIFVGQSSGLALAGALEWLKKHSQALAPDALAVVLLPDSGMKYMSKTYNDSWMQANNLN